MELIFHQSHEMQASLVSLVATATTLHLLAKRISPLTTRFHQQVLQSATKALQIFQMTGMGPTWDLKKPSCWCWVMS